MEGTVQYEGSGDVFFAFYNGDVQLTEMPKKDSGLYFEKADCSKGASVIWNSSLWAPTVVNIKETKTKCTLYFSENVSSSSNVEDLMKSNYSEMAYDDTSEQNLRYIGSSPHNYIDIGDRDSSNKPILWRIIGVMNNMTVVDEGNKTHQESLIKIIRADSIGSYSWDTSEYSVNVGKGVNEWSKAYLMTLLNEGAYWNKQKSYCYAGAQFYSTPCDFSSTGLTESVKEKIAKVRWNTGTIGEAYSEAVYNSDENFNVKVLYTAERSNHNGKEQCSGSGNGCTDKVNRTTTWDGYIGLMYPSDYGYAVGGSVRSECLAKSMYNWYRGNPKCGEYDWLFTGKDQWTITPVPHSTYAFNVFAVRDSGYEYGGSDASTAYSIRPVAYLRRDVEIVIDEGTIDNPHTLKS